MNEKEAGIGPYFFTKTCFESSMVYFIRIEVFGDSINPFHEYVT